MIFRKIARGIVPALAASFLVPSVAVARSHVHRAVKSHRRHGNCLAHRTRHVGRRASAADDRLPPGAIVMPGCVFVPGVGILGEACDLPTSACPNEYRDIQ